MYIDPEKVFSQLKEVRLSAKFQEQLFERNKYIYSSGVKYVPKSVHRVSQDGHKELGYFEKGSFVPITL